jgi:excinuclease ABC subunit C
MRGGRMTGRELFNSRSAAKEDESLVTFLAAYYSPDRPPPPRIYLTGLSVQVDALDRYFREQFGYTPGLIWQEGLEKKHIAALTMARQNAQEELKRRLRERGAGPALDELKRVLGLKARPERIEGFDIAQLEGKHPVASLISFKNGIPDRKNYRYFKLRTVIGIFDDFASIREAVQRRYARLVREGQELPDLVLIDGGIGQVNSARSVMDELGIDCDVIGLAKREEEIWLPHTASPVVLSQRSEALKVLQHVRDETHRFATGLNQRLRSGDLYFPVLESIEGIGPKRAANIMKAYGNLEKIAAADPQEIAEKCGVSPTAARATRSAARLAIEEQDTKKKKLSIGMYRHSDSAADLAAEAFAAEETPDYKP